jgi:hypothetical protein
MRLPKEASTFTPIDDDTYNKAGDVLEVITLWDRLADTFKTDKLRNQIKAIAGEDILVHLI